MNATILCVGKLKERWQVEGCDEYLKRLSRYGKYEIVAVETFALFRLVCMPIIKKKVVEQSCSCGGTGVQRKKSANNIIII